MCTQHVKYFRKVLIQKIFADKFSFQPYPTAKIRLRLQSVRGASLHAAGPPAPCTQTQPNLSKRGSCLCSQAHTTVWRTWLFNGDTQTSHRALAQHRTGTGRALLGTASTWMTANHHAPAPPVDGKPGDALQGHPEADLTSKKKLKEVFAYWSVHETSELVSRWLPSIYNSKRKQRRARRPHLCWEGPVLV